MNRVAALISSTALTLVLTDPALAQATVTPPVQSERRETTLEPPEPGAEDTLARDEPQGAVVRLPGAAPASDEQEEEPSSSAVSPDETQDAQEEFDPGIPLNSEGRPDINPYDRDLNLTVPLTFGSRSLGEIEMLMTADDRIYLNSETFVRLMDETLNDESLAVLAARLADIVQFEPEYLNGTGIALTYDPRSLAVVLVQIAPENRAIVDLFAPPREDADDANLQPANFSAYLNVGVIQAYFWEQSDLQRPTVTLDGAVRVGPVVFEGDGQFSEQLGLTDTEYVFQRNFARLVYDEPEKFRRWFAGDLDPEIRGQQSFVQMGGVGVLRQRRRFNGFRSAILQTDRQLVLQRAANVRFLRNGVLFREVRLDPGRYDFSQLPLIAGSNDIDIQIADFNGGIQNLSFQQYLDPIDLDPGDFEYGLYFGPTSQVFAGAPDYQGPLAVTGFFRKAFFDRPALGIGVQASEEVQNLTSQIQFVLPNSGRLLFDAGVSTARVGEGFAAGVSYEHFFERESLNDTLNIRADYISPQYASLGNPEAINTAEFTLSAQYTRQFTQRFFVTANTSYIRARQDIGDSFRIGANGFYRLNRRWTFRAGADYSEFPTATGRGTGFNITAGIIFQPDFRRRAEARYESRNNLAELTYNQSGLNQLNSVGFGGILQSQDDSVLGQGFIGYAANRFDVQATHASFGPDISGFGATNITSVRVGTTIAYADNQFGIGRRINDSFILLKPHPTLDGRSVVAGQSLARNNYISKSGAFGSALNNFLGSYATQSVQYDVEDPPPGYDTGDGIFRVFPPYKSGYAAVIGTDAFVTVMGTFLLVRDDPGSLAAVVGREQPVSLAGGRVTMLNPEEGENPEPLPFFTNSAGRFAISSLLPGRTYLVETFGQDGTTGYTFRFTVPEDTDGLVKIGDILPGTEWVPE